MRQFQKQRRDDESYVQVTVIPLLNKDRLVGSIADDLGLDETTVCRYARAFTELDLTQYRDPCDGLAIADSELR